MGNPPRATMSTPAPAAMADQDDVRTFVPNDAEWGSLCDDGKHGEVCGEIMKGAMEYLKANTNFQGYKFFVKASILQINGFAQCATTYWTPDGMDISCNCNNEKGVMVILTA